MLKYLWYVLKSLDCRICVEQPSEPTQCTAVVAMATSAYLRNDLCSKYLAANRLPYSGVFIGGD